MLRVKEKPLKYFFLNKKKTLESTQIMGMLKSQLLKKKSRDASKLSSENTQLNENTTTITNINNNTVTLSSL